MAEWRRRSISSLMALSFNIGVCGRDIRLGLVVVVGDETFYRIIGEKPRISVQIRLASAFIFGSKISVGRLHRAMMFAIVKVLPEPVTPSSVWRRHPSWMPCTSASIACGWSPVG